VVELVDTPDLGSGAARCEGSSPFLGSFLYIMKDCVIGIIFNRDKSEVLLTKRRDVPLWVLPGGGIEANEKCEEAVIREVSEETGLNIAIKRKTGHYCPINRLARTTHVFECQALSGTPQLSVETKEIGFFPLSHLPSPFFELHQDWLNDALEDRTHPVRKPLKQVTYFAVFIYFLRHPLLVIRAFLARLGLPINS
jgi:8-oxo-dGTP diphosphatase